MYCYEIGGVGFGFETDSELLESSYYSLFRIDETDFNALESKHIFTFSDDCPDEEMTEIFDGGSYKVYRTSDGYKKISSRVDEYRYKCIFTEKDGLNGGTLHFTNGGIEKLKTTIELFRLTDFISALLRFDAVMIHASFIEYNGKAILFSAPSGTGKSTQAELWRKYKGARIINGDRVIIRKMDSGWMAYGCPACGSSDICVNTSVPLDTIVFLKQSKENRVNEMPPLERFMRLSSQISCGVRKKNDTDKILALTENLLNDINIYELECTPDKGAVQALEKNIGGGTDG